MKDLRYFSPTFLILMPSLSLNTGSIIALSLKFSMNATNFAEDIGINCCLLNYACFMPCSYETGYKSLSIHSGHKLFRDSFLR